MLQEEAERAEVERAERQQRLEQEMRQRAISVRCSILSIKLSTGAKGPAPPPVPLQQFVPSVEELLPWR